MSGLPERPSIGLLLRLAYQAHSQQIDGALRKAGFDDIHPSAGNVFPFLYEGGSTVSDMAELAHVRKQTMAQAVDQLERSGYVERRPNPADGRSQLVVLTDRGRSVPRVTHKAATDVEKQWTKLIGTDELDALRTLLSQLVERLSANAQP